AWSNPTFTVTSSMPGTNSALYGEEVQTTVDHSKTSPFDCLSWAAIVFSTTVMDAEGDGLVDKLEDQSGLLNPAGEPYADIHAMHASSEHKDLLVEVSHMLTDVSLTYGGTPGPAHDHMPTPAVLKIVGDALMHLSNPFPGAEQVFP